MRFACKNVRFHDRGVCECFLTVNDSCGVDDTAELLCGLEQTRCVGALSGLLARVNPRCFPCFVRSIVDLVAEQARCAGALSGLLAKVNPRRFPCFVRSIVDLVVEQTKRCVGV